MPITLGEIAVPDETVWTIENEPPPLESDGQMASEKDFRDLSNTVASIKTTLDMWGKIASVAVVAALGALGWCWHLSSIVTVLQTGGDTRLLTELKNPESPERFKAALYTVIAQIETARAEGKQPDKKKVDALSDSLSQAVQRHPDVPEAWRAAAMLVNYKFQPKAALPNCTDLPTNAAHDQRVNADGSISSYPPGTFPEKAVSLNIYDLSNCTINLSDNGNFYSTTLGDRIREDRKRASKSAKFELRLFNARVLFTGPNTLPFDLIQFKDCTFQVTPGDGIPSPASRSITTQLLAVNSTEGKIEVPSGM